MPSKRLRVILPTVALAASTACATNPVTGEREISLMSEAQEVQLGQQYDAEVRQQMRPYDDPELQRYVQGIAMRLAKGSHRPNLPWHFTVVDVPAINAFALPGGYIYITRGILAYLDDEAQLAGVLGHEIGHVTARHAAQQYTKATGGQLGLVALGIFVPQARPFGQLAETGLALLFLKHGREDELQADRLGVEYAGKSGWDPQAVPDFLNTLARVGEETDRSGVPNWLATHPHPEDRVVRARAAIKELNVASAGAAVERERYLRQVDGIIFGDNPEDGIVRRDEFLHPAMRFAVRFPTEWTVSNSAQQVVARSPRGDLHMILQLEQQVQGRNIEQIAVTSMRRRGLEPLEGGRTEINGLDAFIGTYRGQLQNVGTVGVRGAHILHNNQVYLLVGLAQADAYSAAVETFTRSIRTFRPLSRAEAADIHPNRVDLYVVRQGDTWASIAARADNLVKASTLAIMNDHSVDQPPRPGNRIKIVVAG
jgi:predicted Zn-dependent protease